MSETVYGDDSIPPTVRSGTSSVEVEALEICETSSATTTGDIELNQNHSDDDLTDKDDDLPSLRDLLEWKRNPDVIDLTAVDDVDSSLSSPPSPASEITIAPMLVAPALSSAITPPQPPVSPTQPSGSSTTHIVGTTSLVTRTPRKTPFKNIPWWSAFRDEPLRVSARSSDAARLAVERESDSESNSDVEGAAMQHPVPFDAHGDAAAKVCRVANSASALRIEDIATGGPTFDPAPHLSLGNTDSLEIPETPSVPGKARCPVHPSVVRVVGKRLHPKRPQYLVLCWIHSPGSEASHLDLDRRFREYDEKVSRDLAQQDRLSTLRSGKQLKLQSKHFPADQNPGRSRKRRRTHPATSTSQNYAYPSRQVVEDLFLDVDIRSVDLSPI